MNLSRTKSRFGLNRRDASPKATGFCFHAVRFLSILLREYQRDRINLRAAALTYSVVLSLVPMLALSTAVLKGMGAGDQMREAAYRLIDNLSGEMQKSEVIPFKNPPAAPVQTEPRSSPDDPATKPQTDPLAPPAEKAKDFSAHLNDAVNKVFDYVDRTNFAALGAIGTFLLLITVLIVINGIEEAMNAIWKVEKSRSAGRKVINYMALLIICPLAVNLGIGATTMLNTPAISQRLEIFFPLAWMQACFFKLAPLLLLTATFVIFYLFLPNTKVRAGAAWIGGLAGALGLVLLQKFFIFMQIGVAKYNTIYGSFATVPLFLLWLHSAWLVFFIGAEIAFTTQHFRRDQISGARLEPGTSLALTFDLLNAIYDGFNRRREPDLDDLSAATGASSAATTGVLKQLLAAGLVRKTDKDPETYLPATPAKHLKAAEVATLWWQTTPDTTSNESPGRKMAAGFLAGGSRDLPENPWPH